MPGTMMHPKRNPRFVTLCDFLTLYEYLTLYDRQM